jgi:hypothetical protein
MWDPLAGGENGRARLIPDQLALGFCERGLRPALTVGAAVVDFARLAFGRGAGSASCLGSRLRR